MNLSSIFFWSILATSMILCTALLGEYENNPREVVRTVFGSSILASLAIAGFMTLLARRFAIPRFIAGMTEGALLSPSITAIFSGLSEKIGVRAKLLNAKVGNAFSLNVRGENVVAISAPLVESLSQDEAEAVFAHELAHLKNRDSIGKGLARIGRLAFPFDPVLRLLEPAFHRERELLADVSSVRYTGKPLALASALIKVHSGQALPQNQPTAGFFVGGGKRGLFSFYPDLEKRVERLLKLAERMKQRQPLTVPA